MPDAAVPTSLITVLVIAVTALAGVIVYLFKHYEGKIAEHVKERIAWATERIKLAADLEAKHRALLDNQVKFMSELHEASREHENASRREFATTMEMVADKGTEASEKVAAVLDKFLDRFVTGRRKG